MHPAETGKIYPQSNKKINVMLENTEEKTDVSIIIVNYNTSELTAKCIDSIIEKTADIEYEIIVVDNASKEDTGILRNNRHIRFVASDTNLGFGKANNLGAQNAEGEYLFFLNPDTYLINNAVYILYKAISENSETGICGGNLYKMDMTPNHSFKMNFPGIWAELTDTVSKVFSRRNLDFNYTGKPKKVAYITGADLMIKKELFVKAGGFDKDFFMYFEETYLCHTVKALGYDIVSIPEARIVHLEGSSFNLKTNREDLFHVSQKLFINKAHKSFLYYYFFKIAFIINNLMKYLLLLLMRSERRNIILYRLKKMINE